MHIALLVIVMSFVLLSSLQATIVILLVGATQVCCGTMLTPRVRRLMWGFVLIRLVVPDFPESQFSLMNWFPDPATALSSEDRRSADFVDDQPDSTSFAIAPSAVLQRLKREDTVFANSYSASPSDVNYTPQPGFAFEAVSEPASRVMTDTIGQVLFLIWKASSQNSQLHDLRPVCRVRSLDFCMGDSELRF